MTSIVVVKEKVAESQRFVLIHRLGGWTPVFGAFSVELFLLLTGLDVIPAGAPFDLYTLVDIAVLIGANIVVIASGIWLLLLARGRRRIEIEPGVIRAEFQEIRGFPTPNRNQITPDDLISIARETRLGKNFYVLVLRSGKRYFVRPEAFEDPQRVEVYLDEWARAAVSRDL